MKRPALTWLDRQPYQPLWKRMRQRAEAIAAGAASEAVWACEHEPVYTTGRRGIDNRSEACLPAPMIVTDRGGETTFHGPGQLMLYPLLDLRVRRLGVKQYVCLLEQSCIDLLAACGIDAGRREGFPGVWRDGAKLAALGVRVSRGVACHGMALNVDVDPAWFAAIRPCGLASPVLSLSALGVDVPLRELASGWHRCLMERL